MLCEVPKLGHKDYVAFNPFAEILLEPWSTMESQTTLNVAVIKPGVYFCSP